MPRYVRKRDPQLEGESPTFFVRSSRLEQRVKSRAFAILGQRQTKILAPHLLADDERRSRPIRRLHYVSADDRTTLSAAVECPACDGRQWVDCGSSQWNRARRAPGGNEFPSPAIICRSASREFCRWSSCITPKAAVANVRREQPKDDLHISVKGAFAEPAPKGSRRKTTVGGFDWWQRDNPATQASAYAGKWTLESSAHSAMSRFWRTASSACGFGASGSRW